MGKLSVAGRLSLGFGLVFLMLVATALVGLKCLQDLDTQIERMVEKDWKKVAMANDISSAANDVSRIVFTMFHDNARLSEQKQRIQQHRDTVVERLDALEKIVYNPKGKQLIADLKVKRQAFADVYPKVVALLDAGRKEEASTLFTATGMPQLEAYTRAVDDFVRYQGELFELGAKMAGDSYADARLLLIAFMAGAALLAAAISLWIIRSVTRPLGGEPDAARDAVQRIAEGDLAVEFHVKPGDSDSLLAALAKMRDSLNYTLGSIKGGADGVSAAAKSLAASSTQLAQSTSIQSEAAASMAAAIEQVTVSIGQVSDNADETHTITNETGRLSEDGNQVIRQTVDEMRGVAQAVEQASQTICTMGESSQKISSIVHVIREVAEQTNLLALNAAIEAARAGEQGRGFAVVADEVRKLAERTAQATTQISSMIDAVQVDAQGAVAAMERTASRVEQGVSMAERASQSMSHITHSSQQALGRVNDIASALLEQKVAGSELASNVERVAQMAEENSAATREAADTAVHLDTLADGVLSAIGHFRLQRAR